MYRTRAGWDYCQLGVEWWRGKGYIDLKATRRMRLDPWPAGNYLALKRSQSGNGSGAMGRVRSFRSLISSISCLGP